MAGKKRITNNNPSSSGDARLKKLMKLEKSYQEWKNDFTIDYCWSGFMVEQLERGNSKYTLYNYKCFYKRYTKFLDSIWHVTPKEMTIESFETEPNQALFMDFLNKQGLSQSSIMCYLRNYRTFGKWCQEQGYLLDFQCKVRNVKTPIKEVYTEKELYKLMVKPNIQDFHNYRAYLMISLILATGARRRTLANIKICDVDVDGGYINYNVTKTGAVVRLGLDKKIKRDLTEWLNYWRYPKGATENDYLLCNEFGEQMAPNTITYSIAKYNKEHGVEKTSTHLLRHTFAKLWITSGGDIITLAKVLTHTELEMVKHYSNLYSGDIKKEMEEHSAIGQLRTKSGKTLKNRD